MSEVPTVATPDAEKAGTADAQGTQAVAAGETAKQEGNELFKKRDFAAAAQKYSEAIGLDASCAVYFSNRAACYQELGQFSDALADAESCIKLRGDWPKAHQRKAHALLSLERLEEAEQAARAGLEFASEDAGLRGVLDSVEKKRAEEIEEEEEEDEEEEEEEALACGSEDLEDDKLDFGENDCVTLPSGAKGDGQFSRGHQSFCRRTGRTEAQCERDAVVAKSKLAQMEKERKLARQLQEAARNKDKEGQDGAPASVPSVAVPVKKRRRVDGPAPFQP
eukprot:Hpha_TRINITY_DN16283_c2_g2::TRINITY_DN16283_c2_g2_i1::g.16297::m.16297